MLSLKKGDRVLVEAEITAFNVGGEVQVKFDHAYGGNSPVWVSRRTVTPHDSFVTRMRRGIAVWMGDLSCRIYPERKA